MNKIISVFVVSAALSLPALSTSVMASGDHESEHGHSMHKEKGGHDMGGMKNGMMKGMMMKDEHRHDKKGPVGFPVPADHAKKTVHVTLTDSMKMNFKESLGEIEPGTVVQFVIHNEGAIPHEFSINDQKGQQEHAAMMRKMPSMVHNDGNTLTIPPGGSGKLTWQFEGKELVVFACNIPGHYEAGMFKKIAMKH